MTSLCFCQTTASPSHLTPYRCLLHRSPFHSVMPLLSRWTMGQMLFCLPSLLLRMYLELISYWPVWTKGMITASKSCFSVQMYEQFTQQWKTSHPHGPQNISRASPKQLIASWKVKWLHTACLASSQSIEGLRDVLMAWDPRLIRKDIFYTLYNHSNLCTHFRWGNTLSLAATVKEEGVNVLKRV